MPASSLCVYLRPSAANAVSPPFPPSLSAAAPICAHPRPSAASPAVLLRPASLPTVDPDSPKSSDFRRLPPQIRRQFSLQSETFKGIATSPAALDLRPETLAPTTVPLAPPPFPSRLLAPEFTLSAAKGLSPLPPPRLPFR